MKTLIIYQSTYGKTEKILKEILVGKDSLVEMKKIKQVSAQDLEAHDKIALGGAIHAGNIQKEVKDFCEKHSALLENKPLALFLCCLDKEKYVEQMEKNFPPVLMEKASVKAVLGGEVVIKDLPLLLRPLIKAIIKKEEDRYWRNQEGIDAFLSFLS